MRISVLSFECVLLLTDYVSLFTQDEATGMLALNLAANQAVCYGTNDLLLHLETQLLKLVAILGKKAFGPQTARKLSSSGSDSDMHTPVSCSIRR